MSEAPQFSVVIPAYNAEGVIGSAIRSVLQQTEKDLELIVVDDGSSDRTPEVVEAVKDSRVSLVRQTNMGTPGARNTGIAESRGPYVSFLDNDDLWMPNYLETMDEALRADPESGFAYTDGWGLVDRVHRIRKRTAMSGGGPDPPPRDPEDMLVELMRRNFVLSSATVRRTALERVGGFRSGFGGCDDYDLWIRLLCAGYRAVRAPGLLTIQRDRADSQSKDALVMHQGLENVLSATIEEQELSPAARAAATAHLAEVREAAAALSGASGLSRTAYRLRTRLALLRARLRPRRDTYPEPPPPVAAAFPDLDEL
jgi:glycosyltransferase involved in cell wall biosynthesis